MAIVMISCPNTGRDVPTGIETDPSSFENFGATARIQCPACGRIHAWSKTNAWLAGSLWSLHDTKFSARIVRPMADRTRISRQRDGSRTPRGTGRETIRL
jgi:hypothetical protein